MYRLWKREQDMYLYYLDEISEKGLYYDRAKVCC